jgi:hypothetical protein
MPDYRSVMFEVISDDRPQNNFSVITLEGTKPSGDRFRLKIPVFLTDNGWKVVLHSAYDHL